MNLFDVMHAKVLGAISNLGKRKEIPAPLETSRVNIEPPREAHHGDMATNAAMVLAKSAGKAPLALAELIAEELRKEPEVVMCEVVKPGFINLTLQNALWQEHLRVILREGLHYGDCTLGQGEKINVEYISANPTGPMHAGHARIAVVGDVLANLLKKAGYAVTKEYYINDAGNQIDVLARSVYQRYLQALGHNIPAIPEGLYPGDYLIPTGESLAQEAGDRWVGQEEAVWLREIGAYAVNAMMALIKEDLACLGINQDVFTSERSLVASGKVDQAIKELEHKGLIYVGVLEPPKGMLPDDWEPRPQTLFRATQFGDDVDRPLMKSDGSWTYFASDIAYHADKFARGHKTMINVWGADHSGYIKRTQSAVKAITDHQGQLDILICQLVSLYDNGEAVKMSKRAGSFVTLKDVVNAVGKDVVRFMMMTRKCDVTLDFDFAKVVEQSKDNPVFYVNYAHARACSVLRQAEKMSPELVSYSLESTDLSALNDLNELRVIKKLAEWPRLVALAARLHEPHRVAFYLYDLASEFHMMWNKGKENATLRFILPEDTHLTRARLMLVEAVKIVIASGLEVFGVDALEEMH